MACRDCKFFFVFCFLIKRAGWATAFRLYSWMSNNTDNDNLTVASTWWFVHVWTTKPWKWISQKSFHAYSNYPVMKLCMSSVRAKRDIGLKDNFVLLDISFRCCRPEGLFLSIFQLQVWPTSVTKPLFYFYGECLLLHKTRTWPSLIKRVATRGE